MPHRSSMGRLKHKIFRRKSASFTKIDELDENKDNDEVDNEVKNAASSSKTWTSAMGRSLRRRFSAFRRENDENETSVASKSVPERVNVIQFRKSALHRDHSGQNNVRFSSVDEFTPHRYHNSTPPVGNSHLMSDIHLHISPNSELNYVRLMQFNACYEAMPTSSKMVVFDTKLQLKKAFNGLIYQNTRHVLLSNAANDNAIVGILSVTDFIRVLLRLHKMRKEMKDKQEGAIDSCSEKEDSPMNTVGSGNMETVANIQKLGISDEKKLASSTDEECQEEKKIKEGAANASTKMLEEDIGILTISEYRDLIRSEGKLTDLVSITAEESLLKAARLLSKYHIHRLPVLDPNDGSPLFILTHKRILKFLWLFGHSLSIPDHHMKTCKELGVGTYDGIRVVYPDTSLTLCLDILLNKGVSGVPVVEHETFRVVDMYSRFDAIGVALEDKIDELDVTVQEALAFRNTFRQEKDRVVSISVEDSLWTAMTVLVERNVHRLCVLKDNGAIEGVISLSDVINFLVVKAAENLPEEESPHHHLRSGQPHNTLGILREGPESVIVSDDNPNSLTSPSSTGNLSEAKADDDDATGSLEEQHGTSEIRKQFAAFSMD